VQHRVSELIEPLRDLFAATFFLFFAFQIDPSQLPAAILPALGLLVVSAGGKLISGNVAARRMGVGPRGRLRAGSTLIARGEFSIVIASLGIGLADGSELGTLAAAYVLLTAIVGPLVAKHADRIYDLVRPAPPKPDRRAAISTRAEAAASTPR
jgi:CPA2 family monovalent cation:H+ antiporter-2